MVPGHKGHTVLTPRFGGMGHGSQYEEKNYLEAADPGFKEALIQLNTRPQTISDFSLQSQNSHSEKKYDLSPGGKKDAPTNSSSGRSWFATIGDDKNSPPNLSSGKSWFAKM